MSGQSRLGNGEIAQGNLKGEAFIEALTKEMTGEHAVNEGSEADNQKSDN